MHRKTRENSTNLVLDGIKLFQNPQDLQRAIQIASINLAKHYEENDQNDLNEKLLLIANFIMPNDSSVLTSLANFYHNKCEFKKSYSMALAATRSLNNQSIDAMLNAAITATDAGLRDDAFKFFKMALRKDKNCHRAKFGLATEYFRQNKLKEAWSLYSSRHEAFETDRYLPEKIKSLPRWDGKSDGNLLLYNEQGYGDFIFGLRYLQFIDKNKNPVKIHADKNFKPFIDSTVDSYNYFPNKFTPQYRSSILDLPYLLKKFGFYQDAYKKLFNQRDIVSNKKCRVGIAYSGSTGYHGDRTRSILLSKFKQFLSGMDFEITVVQKPSKKNLYCDCKFGKSVDFKDFEQTSIFLKKLDFVISVDTSIAHMCGALNIPVFVLLSKNPDYRWWENDKTSWYDSWKIIRQTEFNNWDSCFSLLIDELKIHHR